MSGQNQLGSMELVTKDLRTAFVENYIVSMKLA